MQCKMQSVSSRIWPRVAVSTSNDDNHYTMGTSVYVGCRLKKETRLHLCIDRTPELTDIKIVSAVNGWRAVWSAFKL